MFGSFGFNNNGLPTRRTQRPTKFAEHYRVYPVSFVDKAHLEDGDKILLPPSALETLARLDIDYPMLFRLENESNDTAQTRVSHCGVLEFSAPEGSCYMPYWMMQNLFLTEGALLHVSNVTLPKATFVKIRPQSVDFLKITNPRAVLEASLRKFSCMTVGDTICLQYNSRKYFLDVREVRPAEAACIIETDCEVDFEAPVDYVPPAVPVSRSSTGTPPAAPVSSLPYGGIPTVAAGDSFSTSKTKLRGASGGLRFNSPSLASTGEKNNAANNSSDIQDVRNARMKKYEAFHGTGQSMSGIVGVKPPLPVASQHSTTQNNISESVFPPSSETKQPSTTSTPDEKKKKMQPFEGEGRRLR